MAQSAPLTYTPEQYTAAQERGEQPKAVSYACWLSAQQAPRRLARSMPYEDRAQPTGCVG